MKFQQIQTTPKTFVLIFDAGDDLAEGLKTFAVDQNLSDASFKAIGALKSVELGWYNPSTHAYDTAAKLTEQLEVLSLIGDVAQADGEPVVHAHMVCGRSDGSTVGGHLVHAVVNPTCEVFLTEAPVHLKKMVDPASGLLLIKL